MINQGPTKIEYKENEKSEKNMYPKELALVEVSSKKQLMTTEHAGKAKDNTQIVFSHDTVAKAVPVTSAIGAAAGKVLGQAYGPEFARAASDATRKALEEQGDKYAKDIAKASGLDWLPFGEQLIRAEVTEISEKASRQTYDSVNKVVSNRTAAIGGALTGAATVILMEGANLLAYAYNEYQQSQQRKTTLAENKKEQSRIKDSGVESQELTDELEGFTLLTMK